MFIGEKDAEPAPRTQEIGAGGEIPYFVGLAVGAGTGFALPVGTTGAPLGLAVGRGVGSAPGFFTLLVEVGAAVMVGTGVGTGGAVTDTTGRGVTGGGGVSSISCVYQ